jgi:type III pantothenate kinase
MLLVVDAGNTNVVVAVNDGESWRGIWRIATEPQRTSDEYAVWLVTLLGMAGLKREDVTSAVIGTVVPAALYHLRRLCRDWFDVEPLVARAALDWGFEIKMDNPDEVGADRLLNALAGHRKYGGPLVVIDFGTATTFDVVDHDGAYIGGVIAPGINLSIEALHRAAARLPRIGIGRPQSASHAIRDLLGLCRHDRRAGGANSSGIWWQDEGAGDGWSGTAARRRNAGHWPYRSGSDTRWAAPVGGA